MPCDARCDKIARSEMHNKNEVTFSNTVLSHRRIKMARKYKIKLRLRAKRDYEDKGLLLGAGNFCNSNLHVVFIVKR